MLSRICKTCGSALSYQMEEKGLMMRGRRKHAALFGILGVVLMMNGCIPGGRQETQQTGVAETGSDKERGETAADAQKESGFPESYQEMVNDVVFDLNVEVPEGADLAELQAYSAQRQYPDSSSAKTAFAAGKSVREEKRM